MAKKYRKQKHFFNRDWSYIYGFTINEKSFSNQVDLEDHKIRESKEFLTHLKEHYGITNIYYDNSFPRERVDEVTFNYRYKGNIKEYFVAC